MSISVNGQSCVPPGFRFHPTEEELLNYYLRKKVASEQIDLDVIRDVDLNKLEPWDIQEKCKIGSGPQNDWYFFSHKDKKYPTGTRTNRATAAGFWKATGRDKAIYNAVKRIGMRKTLVFYKGRAPHGQKSDWIMHEYRLDDPAAVDTPTATAMVTAASRYLRPIETVLGGHGFMKLPPLESPSAPLTTTATTPPRVATGGCELLAASADGGADHHLHHRSGITDWAMMDRLVASHLNGQHDASADQLCFDGSNVAPGGDSDVDAAVDGLAFYSAAATRLLGGIAATSATATAAGSDDDLWSFARSAASSERLSHVSH